jgi:hypothetical protein
MAQQIIPFIPSLDKPFQFDAILDGVTYQATITQLQNVMWMELTQYGQEPLFKKPVMRSPDSADINLVQGYGITSVFIYREASNCFEIDSTRARQ